MVICERGIGLSVGIVGAELGALVIGGPICRARLYRVHRDFGVRAAIFVFLRGEPCAQEDGLVEHVRINNHRQRDLDGRL